MRKLWRTCGRQIQQATELAIRRAKHLELKLSNKRIINLLYPQDKITALEQKQAASVRVALELLPASNRKCSSARYTNVTAAAKGATLVPSLPLVVSACSGAAVTTSLASKPPIHSAWTCSLAGGNELSGKTSLPM